MNFLKAVGLRFTVFSILLLSVFIGCSNSVSIEKLVFDKCKVLLDGKLYSGEFQKNNLNNNLIIGIVENGFLIETREYISERKLGSRRPGDVCGTLRLKNGRLKNCSRTPRLEPCQWRESPARARSHDGSASRWASQLV